jgi:hypothetical protein
MDETNPATASTRLAIEFLTLWMESDRESAAEHIGRVLDDPDGPGPHSAIVGLLNLGVLLVFELAHEQDAEDIRERAGEILRNLSPQLPD